MYHLDGVNIRKLFFLHQILFQHRSEKTNKSILRIDERYFA